MAKFSKQMENLVASALPPNPCPNEFLKYVKLFHANNGEVPQPENAMFGTVFEQKPSVPKPMGTQRNQDVACKIALEFEAVGQSQGIELTDLDSWFCGLAKFVLAPAVLFDSEMEQEAAWKQRLKNCAGICTPRQVSVTSLKTYTNALARAVKQVNGPTVVVNSEKVLPRFSALMQEFGNRCVSFHDDPRKW